MIIVVDSNDVVTLGQRFVAGPGSAMTDEDGILYPECEVDALGDGMLRLKERTFPPKTVTINFDYFADGGPLGFETAERIGFDCFAAGVPVPGNDDSGTEEQPLEMACFAGGRPLAYEVLREVRFDYFAEGVPEG